MRGVQPAPEKHGLAEGGVLIYVLVVLAVHVYRSIVYISHRSKFEFVDLLRSAFFVVQSFACCL